MELYSFFQFFSFISLEFVYIVQSKHIKSEIFCFSACNMCFSVWLVMLFNTDVRVHARIINLFAAITTDNK